MQSLPGPLLTCWPVITEAAWLLKKDPSKVEHLLELIGSLVQIVPIEGSETEAITSIMRRYRDLRPQLADACLVHLAHREEIDTIFTLDRRDFSVYRTKGKRPFQIVP